MSEPREVNEIIGRALLTLPRMIDNSGSNDWGNGLVGLDGSWSYDEIGAAVVKALNEAGYDVVERDIGGRDV